MRVLITRPKQEATNLSSMLESLGASIELFPTIEIIPTPQSLLLEEAIQSLSTADILIFISKNAVKYTMPYIKKAWPILPPLQWASIGPGTTTMLLLESSTLPSILRPQNPPYESESLLALPEFQNIHGKRIIIFRGNGGRDYLPNILMARGASVALIETYQRLCPKVDLISWQSHWRSHPIDIIISTSSEGLTNLMRLMGSHTPFLKNIPLVIVGLRMFKLARTLGFRDIILAKGADDLSLVTALKEYWEFE